MIGKILFKNQYLEDKKIHIKLMQSVDLDRVIDVYNNKDVEKQ